MAKDNFERCLAATLKWEGGYSNHPDDPGGPTMRGVIQREYDAYRKRKGKGKRPVKQIEEAELREIYRSGYWDAVGCDELAPGYDLCMFDAAVNSGPGRAKAWHSAASGDIDAFCDSRLGFLKKLRTWRVFGTGWSRRVAGIRAEAHRMANPAPTPTVDHTAGDDLHAGMKGPRIRALQTRLRALGYPVGAIDGIYGQQTYRAVALFMTDHDIDGDASVWLPAYDEILANAEPMLPKRKEATHKDLQAAGDKPVARMNLLQRIFAWVFGASAVAQVTDASSVVDSINGVRNILEPLQGIAAWVSGNRWLLIAAGCAAVIMIIRQLRDNHVNAYRHFDYQGPFTKEPQ